MKTKTSPYGSEGFTLLELLLVLALLASLAFVALPRAGAWIDNMNYKDSVKRLYAALAVARLDAMRLGVIKAIRIKKQGYAVQIGEEEIRLEGGANVVSLGSRDGWSAETYSLICLYPDGSADNGLIVIQGSGARATISINPVTGKAVLAWN